MAEQFSVKYRPNSLDTMVVGNPEVLDLAESMAKTAQAILITGHSGCGKTTLGLILNTIVNGNNAHRTLIDRNCASKDEGGKDAIKEVEQAIAYQPSGKKHVVLLDEVQGLSPSAMSALLKVIETPPHKKVLFILCTNEPFKLKETLVNRCRKLHLKQADPKQLALYLYRIVKRLGLKSVSVEMQKKMCMKVAKASACVPREALQLLEDCVDLIRAGKNWDIIQKSIMKAEDGNVDRLVGSTLIAIYTALKEKDAGSEAAMHILEHMPSDAMGYLTRLQTSNYYGMQIMMGGKFVWQGKTMVEALRSHKIKPTLGQMLYVSSALNDIRERLRDMVTDPTVTIGTGIAKLCVGMK